MAERMGVPITLPHVSPQPYTRLAFQGCQYAKENGKAIGSSGIQGSYETGKYKEAHPQALEHANSENIISVPHFRYW
ncbi:hypothetical protein [Paenibacillus glucanolyticus]|uniref:hypothetical protein n=1 Tax=Paenibacillus glucanolyticus TaxID=59843 RepID=UPI00096E9D82|nr:hypothetical protein [Paenibacillus glucanolyticus]OMF66253.1 hypothetical protein BK142_29620 [Paenibacillus glucanolyticus]